MHFPAPPTDDALRGRLHRHAIVLSLTCWLTATVCSLAMGQTAPVPPDCGADLCVGPGFEFRVPSEAARRAVDGNTVAIAPGVYEDCARWNASVSIRGVGGRPHIRGKVCNGKALWITRGDHIEIENVEFSDAWVRAGNGNAIRHEGRTLILRNVVVHDTQMGILTSHGRQRTLEVHDSRFHGQRSERALAHSIYAGRIGRFVAIGNDFADGHSGHFIKTVATENRIEYNRIVDARGTAASLIDVWGCSNTTIIGNAMVQYGTAGNLSFVTLRPRGRGENELPCPPEVPVHATVAYNTAVFTGPEPLWSALVQNDRARMPWVVMNNLVVHTAQLTMPRNGAALGRVEGNLVIDGPAPQVFMNLPAADLRPAGPLSPAVAGPIAPRREFVPPAGTRARADAIDVGAFARAR